MQGKIEKSTRKRAAPTKYVSPNQLVLEGFETPFAQQLTNQNRWVKLSKVIPWDLIVSKYDNLFLSNEGRPPINGRVVIGAIVIKHILNISDRETILQIQENMFLQYFLGFSSFTNEAPFSSSLFVSIRERLSGEVMNGINDVVAAHGIEMEMQKQESASTAKDKKGKESSEDKEGNKHEPDNDLERCISEGADSEKSEENKIPVIPNQGSLLMDATVAPQNITYPTDLKLLNAARKKSEEIIDKLHKTNIHGVVKVRTYRKVARKKFLNAAKKKQQSKKEIYKANGSQLRFLRRNIKHITYLLSKYEQEKINHKLNEKNLTYIKTINTVYEQQKAMHEQGVHTVENRIVNIHQPYVRPIVRGKQGKKVEFGSKIHVSLVKGFTYLDKLSWDNFNESGCLMDSVNEYKKRHGFYPEKVLADQIYCNRENRRALKELGIKLMGKPLGRPTKEALSNQVSPGERNPVEGKFGQAKVAYGLDNIKAKLKTTSEFWIAAIILVLNLVNLTRLASLCLYELKTKIVKVNLVIQLMLDKKYAINSYTQLL
jgi:transposase, IS5 family